MDGLAWLADFLQGAGVDALALGPLERAALLGLALGESFGAPLAVARLYRFLPNYRTELGNLRHALSPDGGISPYLVEGPGVLGLRGQEALVRDWGRRQGLAEQRWQAAQASILGLCKLPWVEGAAITGPLAWGGIASVDEPVSLAVLCEGGHRGAATGGVETYCRLRGRDLRVEVLLDADALALAPGSAVAALVLLSLRPVVNQEGFEALWAANPWARESLPNSRPEQDGERQSFLRSGRLDGRLAKVRRRLLQVKGAQGPLLGAADRRPLPWDGRRRDSAPKARAWPDPEACGRQWDQACQRVIGLFEEEDRVLREESTAPIAAKVAFEAPKPTQMEERTAVEPVVFRSARTGRGETGQRGRGVGRRNGGRRRSPRRSQP